MAGDWCYGVTAGLHAGFNPRPPISWRATHRRQWPAWAGRGFNPRPPISWRATHRTGGFGDAKLVSIHAHQFHGGRRTERRLDRALQERFNPRPPISWRATHGAADQGSRHAVSIHAHQFHGGRHKCAQHCTDGTSVSIHAHQFHGGRPGPAVAPAPSRCCFNPRPPISWRATVWGGWLRPCRRCFNPRPPISWRATPAPTPSRPTPRGFNPRPPISWRATPDAVCSSLLHALFQSTPTNFMAGDRPLRGRPVHQPSFNPRPPISWRATALSMGGCWQAARFNPRPPISWRATCRRSPARS